MKQELKPEALRLYKPPFKHSHGYVFDSADNMVSDESAHALRVRGWGKICYQENAAHLQDTIGDIIAEALTEYWKRNTGEHESVQTNRQEHANI